MTSILLTYPLDVLRLRLAFEHGYQTMSQVALSMLHEERIASFYYSLGPSLVGIAPSFSSGDSSIFLPNALKTLPNSRYVLRRVLLRD